MEIISALKEGTTSNLLAVPMVNLKAPKEAHVVEVEEDFSGDYKKKAFASASASMASPVHSLSCYV